MDFNKYEMLIDTEIGTTNALYLAMHLFRLTQASKEIEQYMDDNFYIQDLLDDTNKELQKINEISARINKKVKKVSKALKETSVTVKEN